jgi:hypothetical protein
MVVRRRQEVEGREPASQSGVILKAAVWRTRRCSTEKLTKGL